MAQFEISGKNLIQGESQTEYIADRGFSPSSVNLNLTKQRGVLHFRETQTDRGGATLTGNIVADAYDVSFNGQDNYLVDENGAFYTLLDSTFTKRQTVVGSSGDNLSFNLGTTESKQFKGSLFTTAVYGNSAMEIIKMNSTDISTVDSTWWSVTNGMDTTTVAAVNNARHPIEVVEDSIYFGDGSNIHKYDGTTVTQNWAALPTDQNITSLRRHPDGKTLLAFTGKTANFAHAQPDGGRVYYVNPNIADWIREVELTAQVEGTRQHAGVVYVTYGGRFGWFDGTGLRFLKQLETSTTVYSHNFTSMEDILLFRDGRNVIAYGDLGVGNVFWKPFRNTDNSFALNNISYKGGQKLLVAYSDGSGGGTLGEVDYDNGGTVGDFFTNRLFLGSEVVVNQIDILHDITNAAGVSRFKVSERDIDDNTNVVADINHTNQSISHSRVNVDIKSNLLQLNIIPFNDILGIKLLRATYEPVR